MENVDVKVRLLGPVLVEVNGRPVTSFRSHKTVALLAYLVIEGRPVARNYLAELFWPDAPAAEGRGHLRRALHDLLQKAPGMLLTDYATAQFDPALAGQTDMAHFEALRRRGDMPALEAAAALCRGQFLEGLALDDCPTFENWLVVERETWLRRATETLECLLRDHVGARRFDLALGLAWQLLRLDPWREERYGQLMTLLARSGDLAQADKVYRRYRRVLIQELGLEPSTEIEALHERLRMVRAKRPGNVPQTLTPFVGRARELAELIDTLAAPAFRLVTLVGPGGIGKTRLAIEAATRAKDPAACLFLDGAFLVRLDTVSTAAQFLTAVAHALGLTSAMATATLDMVARRLQERETLLVLDGFDRLLPQRNLLLTLLEAAPRLKLLVTCGERLRLPAEQPLALHGLATADGPRPAESEALALFETYARAYGRCPLSAEERAMAAHVCRLVGGMPLAIELAAAWASTHNFGQLAAELERTLDVLSSDQALTDRHASVRAALDSTWSRLKSDEREALRLLAVFPHEFTAEAATRITQIPRWQLMSLVDKSLVEVTNAGPGGREPRYHLHALVRKYAAEALARQGQLHARVQAAHLAYLRQQAAGAPPSESPLTVLAGFVPLRPPRIEHCLMA